MKLTVKGVGPVEVTQKHFVAKGGQKSIYRKGDTAYNVFTDPACCIPEAKVRELAVLQIPNIIKPERMLVDAKGVPVGYTTRWVDNAEPLCKFFTKIYKQNNNIGLDRVTHLAHLLQHITTYTHSKDILIVDLNELNFLIRKLQEMYAIDIDSYVTPSFPATVIMPNIRDWHTHGFNKGSDYFALGIQIFQLFIGIHPYKGGHPDFEHLPMKDRMEARMKANVSAMNPKATMPKVCEPLDVIPPGLRKWLFRTFEEGLRVAPPEDYEAVTVVIQVKQLAGSNLFEITPVETYNGTILDCRTSGPLRVVVTDKGVTLNKEFKPFSQKLHIGFTPKMGWPVGVYLVNNTIHVIDLRTMQETQLGHARDVFGSGDRLYSVIGNDVMEITTTEVANRFLAALKPVGRVLDMPDATKVFDGVVMQQVLDRYIASIFPQSGQCYQINLPELDGYRVLDAKYENNVLMVMAEQKGQYTRFVMRFSSDFSAHDMRVVDNIDYADLNFTVTDAGVCTMVNEDEKIEAFSHKKDYGKVTVMDDPAVDGTMRLFHDGAKVLFSKEDKLYSITMRKK